VNSLPKSPTPHPPPKTPRIGQSMREEEGRRKKGKRNMSVKIV
jgi:hypothetical protein